MRVLSGKHKRALVTQSSTAPRESIFQVTVLEPESNNAIKKWNPPSLLFVMQHIKRAFPLLRNEMRRFSALSGCPLCIPPPLHIRFDVIFQPWHISFSANACLFFLLSFLNSLRPPQHSLWLSLCLAFLFPTGEGKLRPTPAACEDGRIQRWKAQCVCVWEHFGLSCYAVIREWDPLLRQDRSAEYN